MRNNPFGIHARLAAALIIVTIGLAACGGAPAADTAPPATFPAPPAEATAAAPLAELTTGYPVATPADAWPTGYPGEATTSAPLSTPGPGNTAAAVPSSDAVFVPMIGQGVGAER